jgi:phosphoribosylformimino-5-aminoimidazole carboxamide ribotide isomerase
MHRRQDTCGSVKLYPAIDILEGSAVRLIKGDFDVKTVYDSDPLSAALKWVDAGARYLHVVDLDGAKAGAPVNLEHLRRIVAESGVPVQYGGGLRTADAVSQALAAGASRVIVGTAAITAPDMLGRVLSEHEPARIAVSVDVREGRVATHGWLQTSEIKARDAFASLREHGVREFVFTNIDHDGMLDGANRDEVIWAAQEAGEGSLIFSGGIGSTADLRKLVDLKAQEGLERLSGVIVGKALYEGRFTIAEALAALGE